MVDDGGVGLGQSKHDVKTKPSMRMHPSAVLPENPVMPARGRWTLGSRIFSGLGFGIISCGVENCPPMLTVRQSSTPLAIMATITVENKRPLMVFPIAD